LFSLGCLVATSTAIPRNVFVTDMACAPADSTALAMLAISVTLGVNLTITGLVVFFYYLIRYPCCSIWICLRLKAIPPFSTLGHDIFISIAAILSTLSILLAISAYSLMEWPYILVMIGVLMLTRDEELFLYKGLYPNISEPDCIQETTRCLYNPRRWIARHWLYG